MMGLILSPKKERIKFEDVPMFISLITAGERNE
jgi:hypothetical protein